MSIIRPTNKGVVQLHFNQNKTNSYILLLKKSQSETRIKENEKKRQKYETKVPKISPKINK